jgi:hypothetical protein
MDDLTALPWPKGGGRQRYGYTATAEAVRASVRSLNARSFPALAGAWRIADHRQIVSDWRDDCGRWNLSMNSHQALYDIFVHEPTARLVDGLDVALRQADSLGLTEAADSADAAVFVGAWDTVAGYGLVEPAEFGTLLLEPPDSWAVGLIVGSILIADGNDMPVAIAPLAEALKRASAGTV